MSATLSFYALEPGAPGVPAASTTAVYVSALVSLLRGPHGPAGQPAEPTLPGPSGLPGALREEHEADLCSGAEMKRSIEENPQGG